MSADISTAIFELIKLSISKQVENEENPLFDLTNDEEVALAIQAIDRAFIVAVDNAVQQARLDQFSNYDEPYIFDGSIEEVEAPREAEIA